MSNNIIDKIQLSGVTYDIGGQGGSGVSVVEVTQVEYDALPTSAKTDTSKMYVITDAEAGDLTNYYTKTETNTLLGGKADTATTYTKTEVDNAITAATSTKQDTLVSSVNIKTINNTSILGSGNIDIQGGGGGGKAVTGGTNISVTTGETADTINCILNISNGTGTKSIKIGDGVTASGILSLAQGDDANASGNWSTAFGRGKSSQQYAFSANQGQAKRGYSSAFGSSIANNAYGFATGAGANANGYSSFVSGWYTNSNNNYEAAFGNYNNSVSASTTFGDSGNTLFSVGNGTADNARHNAFEIRQNGDIYITSGGTDIKLQDNLGGGGSITIDPSLDSGSTNPVANSAITQNFYNYARFSGNASNGYGVDVSFNEGTGNYMGINLDKLKTTANGTSQTSTTSWCRISTINGKKVFSTNAANVSDFSLVETSAITTSVTSSSTDAQVPSAKAVYDQVGGLKLVKLTQSAYDALSPNYDSNTLYVIVN